MNQTQYKYFKRDISWLSFNYRVLLEAADDTLPVYERLKFLSIYSSNLEEYYKVRVPGYHSSIIENIKLGKAYDKPLQTLIEINEEVTRQNKHFYKIFYDAVLPELENNKIILYQTEKVKSYHKDFINNYFNEEVFPYLQPMIIQKEGIQSFIRDNSIYLVTSLLRKTKKGIDELNPNAITYTLMKVPEQKLQRFVPLPQYKGFHYLMFIEDIIRANMSSIFPGYDILDTFSIQISRDADFTLENEDEENMAERILNKVRKRKLGAITRFHYDTMMPDYFLQFLQEAYDIEREALLKGDRYLNLTDLISLPNPVGKVLEQQLPPPLKVEAFEKNNSILRVIKKEDVLMHFPYQSFDYLLRFLLQAAFDPKVEEIKVTQYRVAEHSAVVNSLISAAKNGKKVTVFVELKARFDEEHNYITSSLMQEAGIKIIYSLPGLKVHAKAAYVRRKGSEKKPIRGYAYLGTGNFNEKTAKIYSDVGLLTSNQNIIEEIDQLFKLLEGEQQKTPFNNILVAQYNMISTIEEMIREEISNVQKGLKGHIILKMNSLQDTKMIKELYKASEAGVKIELIIRGICCLIPNQPYSKNITITRIVDSYLEHSRIWYFHSNGLKKLYITSADWMERNLYRRIEIATPIYDDKIKQEIIDILQIQLNDNTSAVSIDENLNNIPKTNHHPPIRAQQAEYEYLRMIQKE